MSASNELDVLTAALRDAGFSLVSSTDGTMDSGSAEYSSHDLTVKVIKDRGQWFLEGSREELEPVGLWRAFNTAAEFRDAVLTYLKQRSA